MTIYINCKFRFLTGSNIASLSKNEEVKIADYKDCIKIASCEADVESCLNKKNHKCTGIEKLKNTFLSIFKKNNITEVSFKQWVNTPKTELQNFSMNTQDFIKYLGEKTEKLLPHSFVAQEQSKFTRELKDKLKDGEFLVQVDFAENYAFTVQDAVPGFHFNNDQATVYNAVVYYRQNEKVEHCSFVIISDCTNHDATSVYAFNKIIVEYLKKKFSIVKKIYYISDGAPQQYKNYKNIINLCKHITDFGVDAEWHFFATAHGKGPCDGLGASVKRSAIRYCLQSDHDHQILNAKDLYNYLTTTSRITHIDFAFFDKNEYNVTSEFLSERFQTKKRVKNIQEQHAFIPVDGENVMTKHISKSTSSQAFKIL